VGCLWLWAVAAPARGDLITDLTVSVSPPSGGLYSYSYTLTDQTSSTLDASQFFLAVAPGANLSAISAPTGWDVFYAAGDPDVSFLSSDSSFDLSPGTVGNFSMVSAVGPALASDLVRGLDDSTGTFAENSGTILTPSAMVPEPSALVLGVLGAAFAAAVGLARRRPPACGGSRPCHPGSI
jgi:hypothetical protein